MNQITSYTSTRLYLKADVIEPLAMSDMFEVIAAVGTWRMTEADFYSVFANVVASGRYSGLRRKYHDPAAPDKADEFRIG